MKQDQHYVPRTYLKRFVNTNKRLYTIQNNILTLPNRINEFSPKGTGYQPNFYVIKEERQLNRFGLHSPNFIEEHFSRHQENRCNTLIDQLINSSGLIPRDDAVELTLLLLSFKQRNPALRKSFDNKQNIKEVAERRWLDVVSQRSTIEPLVKKYDNKSFEEFLEYGKHWIDRFINDPNTPTNIQTEGILKFFAGQNDTINKVAAGLLNSSWLLFKSAPNSPFITSDNPGFCIDHQDRVYNLNFSDTAAFNFPLSPHHYLVMAGTDLNYNQTDSYKPITRMFADEGIVKLVNKATFVISYKYVYSSNEKALRQAWLDVQPAKGDC